MKKIVLMLLCTFLLVGCSNNGDNNSIDNGVNDNNNETSTNLRNPEIEWCQLYNPNGFDTVTCVIKNPNNEDIDVLYDLVFYKDGKEVSRQEEFSNIGMSSKHNDVIWANVDIPSSKDADEVRMENIKVYKTNYNLVNAEIKYTETIGNQAYFSVKHDTKPTLSTIWIFMYNDKNNNKKCDKDELVITEIQSVMEKETKISLDTDVVNSVYGIDYNNYEIYYNAYVE